MTWQKLFKNPLGHPSLTPQQSAERVKQLRRQGYKVQRVEMLDGSVVVLRSKKPVLREVKRG